MEAEAAVVTTEAAEAAPTTPSEPPKPQEDPHYEGASAEAAAVQISDQLTLQSLPIRQYLESTVVTLLVKRFDNFGENEARGPRGVARILPLEEQPQNEKVEM
eukprot:CAMPEP_0196644660 /NCGR_PEP_ID=MMETSP1085-20130531/7489_1 /TAXON_ID=41879 ORGANISM="Pycnococcus sp, Strain CCMP1998" /NCGR_SAMPLE_ID=MMETSP1085 /ASSEMBLY_ACC=CAM_ASM_000807 /LENGTH=102 /DNA_ID=CAMNT_0041974221 /DNA_START=42 /DNA_END=346 /DNA_ORIENTATION=-